MRRWVKTSNAITLAVAVMLSALTGAARAQNAATSAPANLVENPGAETQLPAAQLLLNPTALWNSLSQGRLDLADTVPQGWGVGGSWNFKFLWGATDKEAHSG